MSGRFAQRLDASAAPAATRCARCRHFCADALELERRMPGLSSLGSAFAAVRARDGLCRLHDRWVSSRAHCAAFAPPAPAVDAPAEERSAGAGLR